MAVVLAQLLLPQVEDVSALEHDPARPTVGSSRRIILPSVDFPLPLSPMSETTSPRSMLETDLLQGQLQPASEGAGPVDLRDPVDLEHAHC